MIKGYKYYKVKKSSTFSDQVDKTADDFLKGEAYLTVAPKFVNRDEFLNHFGARWYLELHGVLQQLLVKDRKTLGIASGLGEHELRLFLKGYHIVASDIVEEAVLVTQRLFPDFRMLVFDIFHPKLEEKWDDVLITVFAFYFDDQQLRQVFNNISLLFDSSKKENRLIFTLRYRDNIFTRWLDYVVVPLEAAVRNLFLRIKKSPYVYKRKMHGWRRSPKEIIKLAKESNYRVGRILHAGYAMELTRSTLFRKIPFFISFMAIIDRFLKVFNNAIVLELIYNTEG